MSLTTKPLATRFLVFGFRILEVTLPLWPVRTQSTGFSTLWTVNSLRKITVFSKKSEGFTVILVKSSYRLTHSYSLITTLPSHEGAMSEVTEVLN